MGSFSVRNEAVVFNFVGKLYRQSDNGSDRTMIAVPCHTLNSPILSGARHGSQNGRVSEVPDVYEVCPLKPCKGGIRQPAHNRPARPIPWREQNKHPASYPCHKDFRRVQRTLQKRVLWRVQGRALPSSAPRYLHPDNPQFETRSLLQSTSVRFII